VTGVQTCALPISIYFYGKYSVKEKETAKKLAQANGINFFAQKTDVYFYNNANQGLE
jgi:hypothetical protein